MSDEEPRRFGLTGAQFERVVFFVLAVPALLGLTILAGWAYASSTGMAVFVVVAGGIILSVLGYQFVTGRDIAAPLPPKRHPPSRRP